MIAQLTTWILDTIRAQGAWSVFWGVLVEQIIIPIPSPAIVMGAGMILVPADLSWLKALWLITEQIVLPGALATTLGSVAIYYLGLWGGKVFVVRFQRYLGFTWEDVAWYGHHISKRGEKVTLWVTRAVPLIPLSPVSLVAGVLDLPLGTFVLWTFLGAVPRCYLLGFLGWRMRGAATLVQKMSGVGALVSGIGLVLVLVGAAVYLKKRSRR